MISKCTLRQSASAAAKIVYTPTQYFITHDTTIYYFTAAQKWGYHEDFSYRWRRLYRQPYLRRTVKRGI